MIFKSCWLVGLLWLFLPGLSWAGETLETPEEIVGHACRQSSIVMLNEAHDGMLRCIRTRKLGLALLPELHAQGVRILAMEALGESFAEEWNRSRRVERFDQDVGYIGQPEMADFMQAALDLGWELRGYDTSGPRYFERFSWFADAPRETILSRSYIQWRENEQAMNLLEIYQSRGTAKILVWCGNGHHAERSREIDLGEGLRFEFNPMGLVFQTLSGVDPFTIDQTRTVQWPNSGQSPRAKAELEAHRSGLEALGGHGGYLIEPGSDAPFDAVILSTENGFE